METDDDALGFTYNEKLYVTRKKGGGGFASADDSVDASI